MNTKTIGWLITVFPIIGMISWFASGIPSDPPGSFEGGYPAYVAELAKLNSDSVHIMFGLGIVSFGIVNAAFLGLKGQVTKAGKSTYASLGGILILVGFAGQIIEPGLFSAATKLSAAMSSEAIAMLTLATTAGGFATAIYSLGFVLLGYSLYQSKLIHVISSYALMLAGVIGLLGGILFYDEALIQAYYYSFIITSVAIGIELIRTGKD